MEPASWIALGSFLLAIITTSTVVVVGSQKTSFNDAENVEIVKQENLIGMNISGPTAIVIEFVVGGIIMFALLFCCKQLFGYVKWCCGHRPHQISFEKKMKMTRKKSMSEPSLPITNMEFTRSDTRKTLPKNVTFDIQNQDVKEPSAPFIPPPLVGLPRIPQTSTSTTSTVSLTVTLPTTTTTTSTIPASPGLQSTLLTRNTKPASPPSTPTSPPQAIPVAATYHTQPADPVAVTPPPIPRTTTPSPQRQTAPTCTRPARQTVSCEECKARAELHTGNTGRYLSYYT